MSHEPLRVATFGSARAELQRHDLLGSEVRFVHEDEAEIVITTAADGSQHAVPVVLLGGGDCPPDIAFAIPSSWQRQDALSILSALARGPVPPGDAPRFEDPEFARLTSQVLNVARRISEAADLRDCEAILMREAMRLADCDHAYFRFYDRRDGSLWSEQTLEVNGQDERQAHSGLTAFTAVTGLVARADRAIADPRYHHSEDNPEGDPNDAILALPLRGSSGEVHGVLTCTRHHARGAFRDLESDLLLLLARLAGSALDQLGVAIRAQEVLEKADSRSLFLSEAIEQQTSAEWGDVLRVSPRWVGKLYVFATLLFVSGLVFLVVAQLSTYSVGPAVLRSSSRVPFVARVGGNVVQVLVKPGDRVTEGQVLAQLDDLEERGVAERTQREFEERLRRHMMEPYEVTAEAQLREARTTLDAALQAVQDRRILALQSGTVGDVRVSPGQRIQPGDTIAYVVDPSAGLEVVALLPGEDLPQLDIGMSLRFELQGYRHVYGTGTIHSISPYVLPPSEARRVLGVDLADSLVITRSVVVVRAELKDTGFTVNDTFLNYHDGMIGSAEVRVASESAMLTIIPAGRRL